MQVYLIILGVFASLIAHSAPLSLSYQGRIVKSDGQPLEYASVSFEFRITNPNGSCVIYREQKNGADMSNSKGMFDTPIGLGTKLFPADPNFTIHDAFAKSGTLQCEGGGTFTPAIDDERTLRVQFHDGAGWKLISPDNIIRSVPYAAHASHAYSAETLGTHAATDFVLTSAIPVCNPGYVLTSSSSGTLTCIADAAGSSGTVNTISGTSPIVATNNGGGSYTISATVGTGSGQLAAGNDSRIVNAIQSGGTAGGDLSGTYPNPTVSRIAGVALTISSPTSGQFLKHNGTAWINSAISTSDISGISSYMTQSAFTTAVTPAASCTTSQSMYWNSVASTFACQNITIPTATSDNFWSGDGKNVYRATGKVGVGTTSPDVSFTVQSTTASTATHPNRTGILVKAEGTDVGGRVAARTASSAENPGFIGYRSQGTLAAPTAINTSQHLLSITGMGYNGTEWKEGAAIILTPGENWDTGKTGANILFKTATNTTDSSVEKMRLTHSGRLGIGATSPTATLDVVATGTGNVFSGRFAANPGATGPGNLNALALDNTFGATNYKNEIKFRGSGNDKFSVGIDPAGAGEQIFYIWDAVSSARRMSIDSSGNVGFGVDSPTQKLDVAGKIKATEFCIGVSCISSWPSGGGSGTVTEVTAVTTLPAASAVSGKFLKSNGTTWSGQNILFSDIKNAVGNSAFSVASCAANQTVNWSSLTDTFGCQNIGSLDASAITAGTIDAARLPASVSAGLWAASGGGATGAILSLNPNGGNVGLGTTTPAAKLDVAGEVKFGNTASTCNSTNEGQQRYNSTDKNMEFCNGTNWTSMGGNSSADAGTWCGGRTWSYSPSSGIGYDKYNSNSATCKGNTLTATINIAIPTAVNNCPTGYTGKFFTVSSGSDPSIYLLTCVKN